jgi:cell wall-associated NlpC family hydrolase
MISKHKLASYTAAGLLGATAAFAFGTQSVHADASEYNAQTAQATAWYSNSQTSYAAPTTTAYQGQTTTTTQPTTTSYQTPTTTTAQQATAATSTTTVSQGAATAIAAAKAQIGTPYSYGGATAGVGFDCSGLTQYALAQAGVTVGHNTVAQESAGTAEPLDQLQPGDLIFWGSQGASYHVALYIGNNQYIDSPTYGQSVEVETISSAFQPSFGVHINY